MKNFIITTGAVLLILAMMHWQFQISHMLRTKEELKTVADEAATAAALCIDAEAYAQDILAFDKEQAGDSAEQVIKRNLPESFKKLRWEICFDVSENLVPQVRVFLYLDRLKVEARCRYIPDSRLSAVSREAIMKE